MRNFVFVGTLMFAVTYSSVCSAGFLFGRNKKSCASEPTCSAPSSCAPVVACQSVCTQVVDHCSTIAACAAPVVECCVTQVAECCAPIVQSPICVAPVAPKPVRVTKRVVRKVVVVKRVVRRPAVSGCGVPTCTPAPVCAPQACAPMILPPPPKHRCGLSRNLGR
jgi:hypothetical protein